MTRTNEKRPGRFRIGMAGATIVVIGATAALGGCSEVPDYLNPVEWYNSTVDYVAGDGKGRRCRRAHPGRRHARGGRRPADAGSWAIRPNGRMSMPPRLHARSAKDWSPTRRAANTLPPSSARAPPRACWSMNRSRPSPPPRKRRRRFPRRRSPWPAPRRPPPRHPAKPMPAMPAPMTAGSPPAPACHRAGRQGAVRRTATARAATRHAAIRAARAAPPTP